MQYKIEKKIHRPAYLQLYEQIREDIVRGVYPYGTRMPSKRLISSETGVSLITVEHAYAILCDEGYTESRERSGYFACYRTTEVLPVSGGLIEEAEAEKLEEELPLPQEGGREVMRYGVLARTMRKVLTTYGEKVLTRSPGSGIWELRQAIAAYLTRSRGIYVNPDQVVIGSGAEYMYSLIVQLLGRDRIFALEDPSYEKIRRMYEANGVSCELLQMGRDGIKSQELQKSRASVLHVTPYNSYPSGITASASKRREYIGWAVKRQGLIIEDDFDSEFTSLTKAEDTLFSLEPEKTVIYLNTFTQTIAPAMRISYMILPTGLLEKFRERVGFYSCTVPTYDQYVIAELINNGDFERHINSVRRKRRKGLLL